MTEILLYVDSYLVSRPIVSTAFGLAILVLALFLSHITVKKVFYKLVGVFSEKMPNILRESIHDEALFRRLALFLPIILFYQGIVFIPHLAADVTAFCRKIAIISSIVVGMRVVTLLLSKANEIYCRYPIARSRPIKGYLQVLTIVLYIFAFIVGIATLLDRSPLVFISGLGALTAVILLVFRDTLLSLVAGVQLTGNKLIRVGDWIEMPQFEANGNVVDIALHVVKVQNWDRTITVIPTHKFLEHSFKNWRGMQEAGGRRIKRSFNIDMNTVRFLSESEIERFSHFVLLRDYLKQKQEELNEYNRQYVGNSSLIANGRRLTNIGTFRIYVTNYLRQHPKIRQDMTFLVRQLQSTPDGLPIEIYVFSNDIVWANYESIQADIFDHILAIASEFGMRIYQRPSGHDFRNSPLRDK